MSPPRSTRRRVLQLAGSGGVVTALGSVGWVGRTAYLTGERDRTYLGDSSQTGCLVDGPRAQSVPSDTLLAELQEFSDLRGDVGLLGAVVFNDGTRWTGAVGNAAHGDQTPFSHDFHLYIGSVTKFFTAALVLRYVYRGDLALTDTIDEWLDFERASDVSVRTLLNHTSGIPNYTEDTWFIARYFGRPTKRWEPEALAQSVSLTPTLIARTVLLNAVAGVLFGWLYWRRSLEAAMVAHASFHVPLIVFSIGQVALL